MTLALAAFGRHPVPTPAKFLQNEGKTDQDPLKNAGGNSGVLEGL